MFDNITGIGQLHWSMYAGSFLMIFWILLYLPKGNPAKAFITSSACVITLYISPIVVLVLGGLSVVGYVFFKEIGEENKQRFAGTHRFTYDFFNNDDRFNGFAVTSKGGASYEHLNENDVSEEMYNAAQCAVSIDPRRWHDGSIVMITEVVEEKGKPVIYDYIVTCEQLENRYEGPGYWDKPEDYKGLPAPEGILAVFMSEFNGPKLTKVRRN
jgi:hypothetical protein